MELDEAIILQRIDELSRITDEPGCLTRFYGSPAMRRANALVQTWMEQAGMTVRRDAIGNLIGHFPAARPDAKILLFGSHLDTVRNAGKFDGPLGVVLAVACVEGLKKAKRTLPFAIEVIAFADEEGARFQSAYLGSRALGGNIAANALALTDADGTTLAQAIRNFDGDPELLSSCRRNGENLLGYIEAHIEQGPVLEEKNLAIGIVTAIAGQTRAKISFTGRAAHAGTTPMNSRHDALAGAAELILEAEKFAREHAGLVATVGQIAVQPNVSNVVPGGCEMTVDVRHQDDKIRRKLPAALTHFLVDLEMRRGLKIHWQTIQETDSVPCDKGLSDLLRNAARRHEPNVIDLPSGAGHDAAAMASITPVTMLFVRCAGGISHHPDESVRAADIRVALDVLTDFVGHELAGHYHS